MFRILPLCSRSPVVAAHSRNKTCGIISQIIERRKYLPHRRTGEVIVGRRRAVVDKTKNSAPQRIFRLIFARAPAHTSLSSVRANNNINK